MSGEPSGIPLVDLSRQHARLAREVEAAVEGVLATGKYILGPQEQAFEQEMAAFLGVRHAIGVGSGTDALFLILKALEVGPGDEVITTPFTFIATADVIANCGATPVFADIDEETFNIDASAVAEAFTGRTRAVIVVHLFGQPADMDRLRDLACERGVALVEDCAQSAGAFSGDRRAGSVGDASAFSFFPTKNLACAGDGGMIATDDDRLADRARMLRAHGSRSKYRHEILGYNSRLDEVQAAILRVKLKHLDAWNAERKAIAEEYDRELKGVATPRVAPGRTHVYHQYTVRARERQALASQLASAGIGNAVYYEVPLHLQPCFAELGYDKGSFPRSETAAGEVLSLPVFPGMTSGEVELVCRTVNNMSG